MCARRKKFLPPGITHALPLLLLQFYFTHPRSHAPWMRITGLSHHQHALTVPYGRAHCRGLWNWHRDHPVKYQPGGSQEPGSDSAFSHMPWVTHPHLPKARGAFRLFPSQTSIWNGCFQGDSIEILPFISHPVHPITVFKTGGISLSPVRWKCTSLVSAGTGDVMRCSPHNTMSWSLHVTHPSYWINETPLRTFCAIIF